MKFQLKNNIKRIKQLFFVNKIIKKVLCKNFKILIINCIYKINKYKISMFVIIKIIALKFSFYINFAFFKKKKVEF